MMTEEKANLLCLVADLLEEGAVAEKCDVLVIRDPAGVIGLQFEDGTEYVVTVTPRENPDRANVAGSTPGASHVLLDDPMADANERRDFVAEQDEAKSFQEQADTIAARVSNERGFGPVDDETVTEEIRLYFFQSGDVVEVHRAKDGAEPDVRVISASEADDMLTGWEVK
jgi:hypothetical protein